MKAPLMIFIALLISVNCSSQSDQYFNPDQADYAKLTGLFYELLNKHRKELKLSEITNDPILSAAALDQSAYQLKTGILSHTQKEPAKATPFDRVIYHNGNYEGVGENCLFNHIYKNTNNDKWTYNELAFALFEQWKNSPGHYANMIKPDYSLGGMGFVIDPKTKRLYATQVFAESKFTPPYQGYSLSPNGFGVKAFDPGKCTLPADEDFLASIIGNYLTIRNDSVFLYYRELERVKRIITGNADGFALDFMLREQFTCGPHQNFHGSPVHDGIMLKPVFKLELLRNNQLARVNEFFSFLGMIPNELKGKNYSISCILIKNITTCKYTYPIEVPEGKLKLVDLKPYWLYYEGKIKPGHFVDEFTFKVPFEQGKSEFNELALNRALAGINSFKPFIKKIYIKSFASVEGNRDHNLQLQANRAEQIKKFILPYSQSSSEVITSGEINYALLRKQVANTKLAYVAKLDEAAIDKKCKSKKFLDSIQPFLASQRVATIRITVEVDYDETTPIEYLHAGLFHRIRDQDSLQARIIYNKLIRAYEQGKISANELCRYKIPLEKRFLPLINNYIAAWCLSDSMDVEGVSLEYIAKAVELSKNSNALRYNTFIYCLRLWETKNTLALDVKTLDRFVKTLDKRYYVQEQIDNAVLNFNLLATPYYHQMRMYKEMDEGLKILKSLLQTANISEKNAVELACYFNTYFKFDWSTDLLKRYVSNNTFKDNNTFFTYLETVGLFRPAESEENYYKLVRKGAGLDRERLCNWLNKTNFQLQRDNETKDIYCEFCNGQ